MRRAALLAAALAASACNCGGSDNPPADTTPPAPPVVLAPASGATVGPAAVVVAGNAEPLATVEVLIDDVVRGTAVAAADGGSWSLSVGVLANGDHTIRARASDAAGNRSTDAVVPFKVDAMAPAAPDVTAPAHDAVIASSAVEFRGTAEAGASVAVRIDGVERSSATAAGDGSWSVTISPFVDDQYSVDAIATDAFGNSSAPSTAFSFRVDTAAPGAPAIDVPREGATVAVKDLQGGKVAFSGTADLDVTLVELELGAQTFTNVAAGGSWTILVTVPDGTGYSARALATDAVGNVSGWSAPRTFSVDTTPPPIPAIDAPTPGQALARANLVSGKVVFSGRAEAGAVVEVYVDTAAGAVADRSGDTWSFGVALQDGPHTVHASAIDAFGNASASSATVSFTLDATPPPVPDVVSPAQGAKLAAANLVGGKVVFSGTTETGTVVEVQVDGGAAATAVVTGTAWTYSAAVADGTRSVSARALDAVGNPSDWSAARTFTLDATPPPVPVVLAPQDGATLHTIDLVGGKLVFSGTEGEVGATVEVRLDGAVVGSAVAAADRTWSVQAFVDSGVHSVTARATDAAGNGSLDSAAISFTLDGTRLAYPLVNPSPVPVTSWGQSVPVIAGDRSALGELFPGQANSWTLGYDFSLFSGHGQQYAYALVLYTGTPTALTHGDLLNDVIHGVLDFFPGPVPLSATESVYLTPLFGAADGVVTATAAAGIPNAPAITGTSAYLNGTSDSRLARPLTLPPGGSYTFRWNHRAVLLRGKVANGADPSYQVVLRDPAGNLLGAPLFSSTVDVLEESRTETRAGLPSDVVLSFELRSAEPGYAVFDDVTLQVDAGAQTSIGDFEAGLDVWAPNAGAESQNVRSGARDVGTLWPPLRITRTFYAPPAATWGRMVDVFENTGATPVATSAVYATSLWGTVPIASVTRTGTVVGWDAVVPTPALKPVRDVGIVFASSSDKGTAVIADGDPAIFIVHDLSVPPGGKVALVHFVVQLGEATLGAASTDAECGSVLAGFPSQEAYRLDLEPGVLRRVANF